jgi:hypothetical protein
MWNAWPLPWSILRWQGFGKDGVLKYKLHADWVTKARRLVTSSMDSTVIIFDIDVMEKKNTFTGHRKGTGSECTKRPKRAKSV